MDDIKQAFRNPFIRVLGIMLVGMFVFVGGMILGLETEAGAHRQEMADQQRLVSLLSEKYEELKKETSPLYCIPESLPDIKSQVEMIEDLPLAFKN